MVKLYQNLFGGFTVASHWLACMSHEVQHLWIARTATLLNVTRLNLLIHNSTIDLIYTYNHNTHNYGCYYGNKYMQKYNTAINDCLPLVC